MTEWRQAQYRASTNLQFRKMPSFPKKLKIDSSHGFLCTYALKKMDSTQKAPAGNDLLVIKSTKRSIL